jgi:dCTP deaminase
MILNDGKIREYTAGPIPTIGWTPFDKDMVQPASIDIRLGDSFCREFFPKNMPIDLSQPLPKNMFDSNPQMLTTKGFVIRAGEFVLASSMEYMRIPYHIQAQVCGRSSIGRLGLFVENAGFIDPGFEGILTLELYNCSKNDYILHPGMRIAQVSFNLLTEPAEQPYGIKKGSHYQGQVGATSSRAPY